MDAVEAGGAIVASSEGEVSGDSSARGASSASAVLELATSAEEARLKVLTKTRVSGSTKGVLSRRIVAFVVLKADALPRLLLILSSNWTPLVSTDEKTEGE